MLLYLKHTSHFWKTKHTGAHYYVLNFQTIIFQLKWTGGKMYYYKVEYVHYVAIVISQMNFITFLTYMFFKNKRKRYLSYFYHRKPNTYRFYKSFNSKKKPGVLRKLSIFCSFITYSHTYKHTYTGTYTYIHIHTYIYIHTYTYVRTYILTYIPIYIYHFTYQYTYPYTYPYTYTNICTYTRTCIHTYIHIYIQGGP